MSFVKQLSSDINRFFAGRCPISGANIKALYVYVSGDKRSFSVNFAYLVIERFPIESQ